MHETVRKGSKIVGKSGRRQRTNGVQLRQVRFSQKSIKKKTGDENESFWQGRKGKNRVKAIENPDGQKKKRQKNEKGERCRKSSPTSGGIEKTSNSRGTQKRPTIRTSPKPAWKDQRVGMPAKNCSGVLH